MNLITDHLTTWTTAPNGIKKLRELILECAVRGLLVPQDINDEPARLLLIKIAEEKTRLINEGIIKPPKLLPKISEHEKPFDLPKGWEWVRLGEIINVLNGRAYKKHEMLQEGTPLLRVGNLFTSNQWYYSNLELEPDKYIDNGDLIYAWSASFGAFIWQGEKVIYHYHIWKLDIFDVESIDKYHLCNFLTSVSQQIKDSGNGIAMIHMTKERMEKLLFPLPPLAEQQRIVAKVNELMKLCDQLEQKQGDSRQTHRQLVSTVLTALTEAADAHAFTAAWSRIAAHFDSLFTTTHSIEQLQQTILQLAVRGKLVPQNPNDEPASELLKNIAVEKVRLIKEGIIKPSKLLPKISEDEKPFNLPNGWEWSHLPEIGELARGKSKHRPRNDPKLYSNGNIPLVQTGDVSKANPLIKTCNSFYNEIGLQQSRLWAAGTMCITIAANIADTGILDFDACFPDSIVGFIPYDKNINIRYFEYFFRTAKNHLENFAPSTAQKNINLEILGKLLVPLPPLNEINNIVTKVDELMQLCEQLKTQLNTAQTLQQQLAETLVQQAVA